MKLLTDELKEERSKIKTLEQGQAFNRKLKEMGFNRSNLESLEWKPALKNHSLPA